MHQSIATIRADPSVASATWARRRRGATMAMLLAVGLAVMTSAAANGDVSAAPAAAVAAAVSPCGQSGAPPPVHHVIWIFMENEALGSVIDNENAPYQTRLAHQCGLPTNFHNESHRSLGNYIAATSGRNILNTSFSNDCLPDLATHVCVRAGPTLFSQAESAGETWRDYAEDMPANCDRTNVGSYLARHNPAVYFSSLTSCSRFDVPMGSASSQTGTFYDDVRGGRLPSFSFITPNAIDDAHNSSTAIGDAWLSEVVPFITTSSNYEAGDTVIFITNDEGSGADQVDNENCSDPSLDLDQTSCHIPTIVIAPHVPTGATDSTFYTHFSLLRTTEELLGLPLLGLAAKAHSMTTAYHLAPVSRTSGQ